VDILWQNVHARSFREAELLLVYKSAVSFAPQILKRFEGGALDPQAGALPKCGWQTKLNANDRRDHPICMGSRTGQTLSMSAGRSIIAPPPSAGLSIQVATLSRLYSDYISRA
jgi:hypothetical protein